VRWAEFAARIDAAARRLTEGRNTSIEISRNNVDFETDPNLLEQILVNLLRNAVDAVDGQPIARIQVDVEPKVNRLWIAVGDNGPGISEENRTKIKQPFFTTKAFGTGLGLPISIRLAEALQGGLELRAGENRGTVASLWLPLKRTSNGTASDRG